MSPPSRSESLRVLEHEVGVLLRRVRRVVHARARTVHEDLQPAAYLMLSYLAEYGAVRASALAGTFDMDKGAVSRQVQHLCDLGLAERAPDPTDGRATLVAATADAVARLDDVRRHRRTWLDDRLGEWPEDELASFVNVLGRYNRALE